MPEKKPTRTADLDYFYGQSSELFSFYRIPKLLFQDMSLSLGQNPGYIRTIESGSAFPAMSNFFYICEYLNVTPQEFFDFKEDHADGINALVDQLDKLDEEQIQALTAFIKTIVK